MEFDRFIEDFGAAIEAEQASVLVGAGLSRGAGYPTWSELIADVADRAGVAQREDNLPLVAQYIENQPDGKQRLLDHIVASIANVIPTPHMNHRLLAQLPIRDRWTTNYEGLIEAADRTIEVIAQDADFTARRTGARRLFKMHGSIPAGADGPVGGRTQLVISRDDYDRYPNTHPRLWRLLQAQFLTTSFLFLGFSLTDPNFDAVFRLVRLAIADNVMPHYAIMRRPDPDTDDGTFAHRAQDLKRVGISILQIASYDEITTLLQRLVARTLPARLLVSGSYRITGEPATTHGAYPTEPRSADLDDIARQLGARLAQSDLPGLVAGGELGATVGYAYLDSLEEYRHDRFTLVRRQQHDGLTPPNQRRGQILFTGDDPADLRSAAFDQVRAIVVIGGGHGTLDEVARARDVGMSVIPFACTGGVAYTVWEEMRADLASYEIGQQPIPPDVFDDLNNTDRDVATSAAVALARSALFMSSRSIKEVED